MASYKGLKAILKKFSDLIEPVATIKEYAGTTVPEWHLFCLGQLLLISKYPKLYKELGGASSPWLRGDEPAGYFRAPDLRECVIVGVGKNTTLIFDNTEYDPATGTAGTQDHDVYALGEFKDDQQQRITGEIFPVTTSRENHGNVQYSGAFYITSHDKGAETGNNAERVNMGIDSSRVVRTGYNQSQVLVGSNTTHGKQVGLNYIIKY